MKLRSLSSLLAVALAVLTSIPTPADAAGDPLQRSRDLVSAMLQVRRTSESVEPSPEERQRLCAAFRSLDDFFAYDQLIAATVQPFRQKFSEAQYREFRIAFRSLIRMISYPGAGDFFRKADYRLAPGTGQGGASAVDLRARLPGEDLETTVTFLWTDTGKVMQVIDIRFDGASLVKDYQNQFRRIVEKEGVPELLKRLTDRHREEQKKVGACP